MSIGRVLVTFIACIAWSDASAQEPVAPVRIGTQGVVQPRPIKTLLPRPPEIALTARVFGAVVVEAVIDATGRVAEAKILQSVPLLDNASLDAIRQWTFEPIILNGRAVPAIVAIKVNFRLVKRVPPMRRASEIGANVPRDFAFVHEYWCGRETVLAVEIDSSRAQLITTSWTSSTVLPGSVVTLQLTAEDLRSIYREYSLAAFVANRDGLNSWMDHRDGITVRDDGVEVDVTSAQPEVDIRRQSPWFNLDIHADGVWTTMAPARAASQSAEYEERIRALRAVIERTVMAKEAVRKLPAERRSCP